MFNNNKRNKSIFWVLSWVVCFSTAVTLAKTLGSHIPTATLILMRSVFAFLMILPLAQRSGFKKSFKVQNKKLLALRMINSFFAIGCTYYAYRNLPLATATSIGFSGPLFITTFAIFILKEKFSLKQWSFLFVGYLGVLIITNPTSMAFEWALVSSIMANTLAGFGINLTKILTRTEETVTLILYGSSFNILLSLVVISIFGGFYFPNLKEFMILFLVGSLGAFSSYSYTQALRFSSPTFVAPFEYTRLLYAIPVGFVFFSEMPELTTLLGACLITFAVYKLTSYKIKLQAIEKLSSSIDDSKFS